jgi:DNA (cytosine-5)-methyltransferase 3A
MNVLALFDGISCGQVALERAGIEVSKYFASEINQKAMEVTYKNYPNTIQLGDITQITEEMLDKLPKIDLIIGGSPCQDLSVYKYDRGDVKGLKGKKSNLFYHYERILKYVNPKYFLLENVPMEPQWNEIITNLLGVEPIIINSELVSAALRKRLYWGNIPNITQPEDKGIMIKDIIVPSEEVPDKYWYSRPFVYNGDDKKVQCTLDISGHRNMKEVYNINGKCNTLLADGDGGNRQKKVYQDGKCRKFMPIEYERMQTLPDNYTEGISDSARYSAIGNGWTVDVIAHIFEGLKTSQKEKVLEEVILI